MFTSQEIFDKVAVHLLTQKERSYRKPISLDVVGLASGCLYRFNGLKCAVGCLIPDEFYQESIETKTVTDLLDHGFLPEVSYQHVKLLQKLQRLHDNDPIGSWKDMLKDCANQYRLSAAILDSFP